MLTCKNITLSSFTRNILDNISFTLLPGSITFIIGPNGSGKTSLLRILSAITEQTSGSILYKGKLLSQQKMPYAQYIGHNWAIKNNLTVKEQIDFFGSIYNNILAAKATLEYLELTNYEHELCRNLSQGNMKKLLLARLLMSKLNIWLIDELDANLDKKNSLLMQNIITTKANNGGIILIATHNTPFIKNPQIIQLEDFKC